MKSPLTPEQKAERATKMAALLEVIEFCNENNIQWQHFQTAAAYKFGADNGIYMGDIGVARRNNNNNHDVMSGF